MERFATTIFAQHSVAMLEQCCNHSKQCRNNVEMMYCIENRRCKSSCVTLAYKGQALSLCC